MLWIFTKIKIYTYIWRGGGGGRNGLGRQNGECTQTQLQKDKQAS
jgi:hypothetical protein